MKCAIGLLSFAALVAVATSQGFGLPFGGGGGGGNQGGGGGLLGNVAKPLTDTAGKVGGLFTKQFGDFQQKFGKQYSSPDEEKKRLGIFSQNQDSILNLEKVKNLPYTLKINDFADLVLNEFNKFFNGLRVDRSKSKGEKFEHKKDPSQLPENVDWREKGAVGDVRHQGQCASCYAFTAAAALESYLYQKSGKLQHLSPQNLMDCSQVKPYSNYGCTSGAVDPTFDYIKDNGINTEETYPYKGKSEGQCTFNKDGTAGTVKRYVLLDDGDEKGLQEAVATKGPVCVGIDAGHQSFQFYGGGVYYEPECGHSVDKINHAVLLIGYGTEPNGQKYWLIKNSYGPEWGEKGFAKLARNVTNYCAIASYALYPELN